MPLHDTPKIRVFFSGLLVLYEVDEGRRFQVGIHGNAPHHELSVVIMERAPNHEVLDTKALPRSAYNKMIKLDVTNPRYPGVQKYQAAKPQDDPNDFRHIITIDELPFHDTMLKFKSGSLTASFYINNGLFYTHDLHGAEVKYPGKDFVPQDVAFVAGADIYFGGSSTALLEYFDDDDWRKLALNAPTSTYDIWVENVDCNPDAHKHEGHSHFHHYYEVFRVDDQKQWADVRRAKDTPDADTHAYPCNLILSSRSAIHG